MKTIRVAALAAMSAMLAACLHDTDVELRNDAPKLAGRDSLVLSLAYPDSAAGAYAVNDPNGDAVRIVPSSWPGSQSWNAAGDSVALGLPADRLGAFAGEMQLVDRRGARTAVPYSVDRSLNGWDTNSTADGWRPYPGRSPDAFSWDEADGVANKWMDFFYDPTVQPGSFVDGEVLGTAVSGDFTIQCGLAWGGDPWQELTPRFLLKPDADSAYRPASSVGVSVYQDSTGPHLRAEGLGIIGRSIPIGKYPKFYTARVEREGADYRILAADSLALANGKWDTLLTVQDRTGDPSKPLFPHCRFAVGHGLTEAFALFQDYTILRGTLVR